MLKALQSQRAKLASDMRALVTKAETENRAFTAEETEQWNRMTADEATLSARIDRVTKVDGFDASVVPPMHNVNAGAQPTADEANKYTAAFEKYIRSRNDSVIPADVMLALNSPVLARQTGPIRAAQTITSTGGGYLVPQGFSDQLDEAMKFYGGMLEAAEIFDTETGNPLPWPTVNDTANSGRIIGINTGVTTTDLVFGSLTFNAWMFSSDQVLVPIQLMQDSYFDLPTFLARRLGERLGRIVNTKLTVGSGTNEPNGVVNGAVSGKVGTTGQTTSIIYDDLVDLIHAVDPAYRRAKTARFMLADSSLKVIKKLKDSSGRPLWQPGISAGLTGNPADPDTILGYPYTINQDVAAMAANAKSVLFGDFSKYKVRRVAGGVTVLRLNERYADNLQVGFVGFQRLDGQLVDAGTHPIAYYANSAT